MPFKQCSDVVLRLFHTYREFNKNCPHTVSETTELVDDKSKLCRDVYCVVLSSYQQSIALSREILLNLSCFIILTRNRRFLNVSLQINTRIALSENKF